MDPHWIEHRRDGDRELLGWIAPEGEDFVAVDRLGRALTEAVDWLAAEEALEEAGLSYLADPYELRLDDGTWLKVRLTEVTPHAIVVKKDDWGAKDIHAAQHFFTLRFPMPPELRAT